MEFDPITGLIMLWDLAGFRPVVLWALWEDWDHTVLYHLLQGCELACSSNDLTKHTLVYISQATWITLGVKEDVQSCHLVICFYDLPGLLICRPTSAFIPFCVFTHAKDQIHTLKIL